MRIYIFLLLLGWCVGIGCGGGSDHAPSASGDPVNNPTDDTVTVYGLGTVSANKVTVDLYADIPTPIVSYGIKLDYPETELIVHSATKNETNWYIGTGTEHLSYKAPEIDGLGSIVMIGGRLDASSPTQGVQGEKVLLGSVVFDRTTSNSLPYNPSMTLTFAREGSYVNFSSTGGTNLDPAHVAFDDITFTQNME